MVNKPAKPSAEQAKLSPPTCASHPADTTNSPAFHLELNEGGTIQVPKTSATVSGSDEQAFQKQYFAQAPVNDFLVANNTYGNSEAREVSSVGTFLKTATVKNWILDICNKLITSPIQPQSPLS